jgi:hypothetical protein
MGEEFGDEYAAYSAQTKRLIPASGRQYLRRAGNDGAGTRAEAVISKIESSLSPGGNGWNRNSETGPSSWDQCFSSLPKLTMPLRGPMRKPRVPVRIAI